MVAFAPTVPRERLRLAKVSENLRVHQLVAEQAQDNLGFAAAGPTVLVVALVFVSSACFADEGVLCRGLLMVSCLVPSSPKLVSEETVQRTRGSANWSA
jgi:hypothetical protein